jgi:hypothetical protein
MKSWEPCQKLSYQMLFYHFNEFHHFSHPGNYISEVEFMLGMAGSCYKNRLHKHISLITPPLLGTWGAATSLACGLCFANPWFPNLCFISIHLFTHIPCQITCGESLNFWFLLENINSLQHFGIWKGKRTTGSISFVAHSGNKSQQGSQRTPIASKGTLIFKFF